MYVFIAGVERTGAVLRNSISITDQLQERVNTATFDMASNKPTEYQEVRLFDGYKILSATANSITIDYGYFINEQTDLFRENETIYVALNLSDEESGIISSLSNDSGKLKLTMAANFTNTPATDEKMGKLQFAGVVIDVSDSNIRTLSNIEYRVDCADYTRLFDKKNINDSFTDKDARYIINDFCNSTINLNDEIDAMDYANNTAVQAEWIESDDGGNPTVDTSDLREGTSSVTLPWTNSSGTATFDATPITRDISEFTGVTSGNPTKGKIAFWYKQSDNTAVSSLNVLIGTGGNYRSIPVTLASNNDWNYAIANLSEGSNLAAVDWTDIDSIGFSITETASANIKIDGIRILENNFFRHDLYVNESTTFDSIRFATKKPIEAMQQIADSLGWYWYIDYERNIHLFNQETNLAPISVSETSDNFSELSISYDVSRLINRQRVEGGNETSTQVYSEVKEGDGFTREWILKNKFKNLEVLLDANSSTDTMEGGTTTTNVTATGHGLITGDYIVNRSRSNAVREITKVDDDNFTVDAVSGQTSGDTFSLFVSQNVGVEGINEDTGNDYMSNFNEKSIRAAETEATLQSSEFLLFKYNEVTPIIVERRQNTSISNMKSVLGYTDGIFDGQPIINRTLQSRFEASKVAQAMVDKYSNVVITAQFRTHKGGIRAGQLINIKDTANGTRNINQNFVIQRVKIRQIEWGENEYTITASSLLFGVLELFQQILKQSRAIDVDEDAQVNNFEDGYEEITISEVVTGTTNLNEQSESVSIADAITEESVFTPPFVYEPDGASVSRYNLASYS